MVLCGGWTSSVCCFLHESAADRQTRMMLHRVGRRVGALAKGCGPTRKGERVRKFGRTTGYTEGTIFSMYLDIRIRYDRTGQSAFFNDQILIAPVLPEFTKFVSKGDSGSVVIDREQRVVGLIFGGMSELPPETPPDMTRPVAADDAKAQRIESYGVANPISDVLDRLKIDLLI